MAWLVVSLTIFPLLCSVLNGLCSSPHLSLELTTSCEVVLVCQIGQAILDLRTREWSRSAPWLNGDQCASYYQREVHDGVVRACFFVLT